MCHNKSTIVVLILLGIFSSVTLSTFAQPAVSTGKECPPGVLSTTIEAPPEGMANLRTIRLDENCKPIFGPVQTVSLERLPDIALDARTRDLSIESGETEERAAGVKVKRVFRAEQA